MKKTALFLAGVLSVPVFAVDYVWTGGGSDTSSWNDAANWEPQRVPGGGDSATFKTAATITDGIIVESGELKITAKAVSVELGGIISGSGAMYFYLPNEANSKIVISGANTYSGGTSVEASTSDNGKNTQIYGIWVQSATAFGSGKTVFHKGGLLNLNCENAVFKYDFEASRGQISSAVRYNAMQSCTLDGYVGGENFGGEITFSTKAGTVKLTVTGKVGGPQASHVNVYGYYSGEAMFFPGGIETTGYIRPSLAPDGYRYGVFSLGKPIVADRILCAYGSWKMTEDYALSEKTFLHFQQYSMSSLKFDLDGHSQTINYISSSSDLVTDKARHVISQTPATLTMRPTKSSLDNTVAVDGAVTLVVDALDPSYVQQFSNRVSTTTGDLVASNGVLRIGKNASFKNVPRLEASGGVIEVLSEVAGSLSGVREIHLEKGGRISLPSTALTAKSAAVTIDENSSLVITDGAALELASLVIGGKTVQPGVYPAGTYPQISGAVSVPLEASATSTGVWTGAGSTEISSDVANWEGGYPGVIPVTFASGGSRALLAESLSVAELKFDTPETVSDFTVAAHESAPDSKIILSGDIVMTNASQSCAHTNTVSVPVAFTGNAAAIKVDGANNTLVLGGALQQKGEFLTITNSGSGTVCWTAADSSISSGNIYFHGGVHYVHGGSLGGSAENLLAAQVDANMAPVRFYFCGGVHNRNFTFLRSGSNAYDFRFLSGTTNTVNGYVRSQNGANLKYVYEGDSRTILRGGYETTWIYSYWLESHLYRGAVLEILDKPLRAVDSGSARGCFYAHSTGGVGDRVKVVFGASGNFSKNGVYFGGPMKVEMGVDFAFNTNSAGIATALGFMQVPSIVNSDNYAPVVMDLRGHSQRFGDLCTVPVWVEDNKVSGWNGYWGPSSSSYITSESPATLYALQNGYPNKDAYPWYTTFRGAVSLVKEGSNTLVLAGVNTTTGRLEVAEGRLEFTGEGSWLEAGEVAVSGGTLALDRRGRIGIVDLAVSGGTVELAAGVNQRVRSLKVCEGGLWRDVKPGRYFADRLPEAVSGLGSIIVNNAGTRIIVR